MVTTGMIKRAEIRKHLRIAQQLKVGTLVLVLVLLLAAYPTYLFLKANTTDPALSELNGLDLPGWATISKDYAESGSRWCIGQCRFRKLSWASEKTPEETQPVYDTALRDAGWRPLATGPCPTVEAGSLTCWQRDEYIMNMWVRQPSCDIPPPRPTGSANPEASAPPASPTTPAEVCPGALVTVEVWNAIDYPIAE
jgi:integrin beta 3